MSETMRLFVGTSPNGEDYEAEAVLEYSARQLASWPLEITWMRQATAGPFSGWPCASGRTPFSHFRWGIPAVCGFEGRAIYMDVDFIVRADLAELWRQDIPGMVLARTSQKPGGKIKTCCMLFDCAKAKRYLPDLGGLRRMSDPQGALTKAVQQGALASRFEGDWNAIDLGGYADIHDPRIKAIHYSRMETQPHLRHAAPRLASEGRAHWYTGPTFQHDRSDLIALFDRLLAEAQAAGWTYDAFRYEQTGRVDLVRRNFSYSHHKGTAA